MKNIKNKVVRQEKADNLSNKVKKVLIGIAAADLAALIIISGSKHINGKEINTKHPFQIASIEDYSNTKGYLGEINNEDCRIIVAKPQLLDIEGNNVYAAPPGFVISGDYCYRIEIKFEHPGYEKYEINGNSITIGNKIYEIEEPSTYTNEEGKTYNVAPVGYILNGNICYRVKQLENSKSL